MWNHWLICETINARQNAKRNPFNPIAVDHIESGNIKTNQFSYSHRVLHYTKLLNTFENRFFGTVKHKHKHKHEHQIKKFHTIETQTQNSITAFRNFLQTHTTKLLTQQNTHTDIRKANRFWLLTTGLIDFFSLPNINAIAHTTASWGPSASSTISNFTKSNG